MVYIGIDIAKRFYVLSAVGEDGGTLIESFRFTQQRRQASKSCSIG